MLSMRFESFHKLWEILFEPYRTEIITFGVLLAISLSVIITVKYWNHKVTGPLPVSVLVFCSVLFTSGLDVGLVMFPLAWDFPLYADTATTPAYAFTNPLAIEFGYWAFLIWSFYFLTAFYFAVIEPKVRFFEKPLVKTINNVVIIGTCAFTGALFVKYLPYYVPSLSEHPQATRISYLIAFFVILSATLSSMSITFVKILSVSSTWLFAGLILLAWISAKMTFGDFGHSLVALADYFPNIHKFILPMSDYHEFFLYWWFSWSIMIGQFTARFAGGLKTWQFLLAILIIPSIPIAIWFSVLYHYFTASIPLSSAMSWSMVIVGCLYVINSFDSLIRLYSDNIGMTPSKISKLGYIAFHSALLIVLTYLFKTEWLRIEFVGTIVIGLYVASLLNVLIKRRDALKVS